MMFLFSFLWLRAEWWYDHYASAKDAARERARFVAARLADRAPHGRHHEDGHPPVHPARAPIHATETLGERAADAVADGIGSWPFVGAQALATLLWIVLNSVAWFTHWDPRPWIMLNLVYSFQAGFTGPILLLAAKRAAQRDRKRDDLEAQEVELLMQLVRDLHSHTTCSGHTTIGDALGGSGSQPDGQPHQGAGSEAPPPVKPALALRTRKRSVVKNT